MPRMNVGHTPLVHAKKLGSSLGLPYLYLKIESANPSGTQKDRAAYYIVRDAKSKNFQEITIGTCGNFGVALAKFCEEIHINCTVFMPEMYGGHRSNEILSHNAKLVLVEGGYEEAVQASARYAALHHCYDANPTNISAADASIDAYSAIASEICNQLGKNEIGSVWVAVGNGTTLAGIHKGFDDLGVKLLYGAVTSKGNNAVLASYEFGSPLELSPEDIHETAINEPLLNYQSFQVKEALAVLLPGGVIYGATDDEMTSSSNRILDEEGVVSCPSSASVLSGLQNSMNRLDKSKKHILVLTS